MKLSLLPLGRHLLTASMLCAAALNAGCATDAAEEAAGAESEQDLSNVALVWPGRSVGPVRLGMTHAQVTAALGPTQAFGANGVVLAVYPQKGLEIVYSSPQPATVTPDAKVLSVAAFAGPTTWWSPARIGEQRDAVEQRLGVGEPAGDTVFYPQGLGIVYDGAGPTALVKKLGVYPSYSIETRPAEMRRPWPFPWHGAPLDLTGKSLGVVDMHLHPGFFGRIPSASKPFIANAVPPFLKVHLPAVSGAGLDPWAENLGIKAQTDLAGVNHAVLYAVYTQKTTGFMTNEEVERIVTDSRNVAADGLPWAFAFASINFFDGYVRADGTLDQSVAYRRLSALSGYFERRRDVFIGIKLAHAHQGVAFDDARYLGVYDIAARHGVPVYLHTGFTPFAAGQNQPAFYDPQGLENTILNTPSVKFVLGHVGQGDPRSVEHALTLAKKYANVYLEISALNRPLVVDDDGDAVPPDPTKPQYPFVLQQVKARGLVGKTLFGTDGPQSAGMVKGYVTLLTQEMTNQGYTADEIADVMGRNFQRVYFENP